MHLLTMLLLSSFVHKTTAQDFGGFGVTPIFDAPPLEDANIGINAFLAVATLIQLAVAISFVFRVRSQHLAPGIAAIVATSFVTGILYFAVICILCYFFLSIRLWNGPGETELQPYGGGYSGYQHHHQPVAQFPDQWGYPGMPPQQQQQGYVPSNVPYQTYPSPQQGGGGYYPNQQSGQQQDVQQQPSVIPRQGVAGGSPNVEEKSQEPAAQPPTNGVA